MFTNLRRHWIDETSRLGRLLLRREKLLKTSVGTARLRLPPRGPAPSFYLFAMHKGGSTLLNDMMGEALNQANIPQINIPEVAFSAGRPECDILNPEEFIFQHGYCYRGFREFPPYLRRFDLSKTKKILLVRDPRDMLISNYFSVKYSHPIPRTGFIKDSLQRERETATSTEIDGYCLSQLNFFKSEFEGYEHILGTNIRIYRYEDVIFNKIEWLRDMLRYLEITLPFEIIGRIAKKHDIRPEAERPNEHIRQVTPGNFRKHLSNATIDKLNREFKEILATYRYAQ
jgi:hypothetical protein